MTLSKKHYIAIARILKNAYIPLKNDDLKKQEEKKVLFGIIASLNIYFKEDNPLFNEMTFEKAILN